MSKGKCKFYNGKWHLTIRNSLTDQIFSEVIPYPTVQQCFNTKYSVDALGWTSGIQSGTGRPYTHCQFASIGAGYSSQLQVFFTRKGTGIEWEIKNNPHERWSDYTPARKPKLKKSAELISFTK
jgi:hypothetical protein